MISSKRWYFALKQFTGADWVLVIDDASRNFPEPGKTM